MGDYSVALGSHNTVASGNYSFAFGGESGVGNKAQALGDDSIAWGKQTEANAINSIAIGYLAKATGVRGTAFGGNNSAALGQDSMALNGGQAIGNYSLAIGGLLPNQAKANGDKSIAIGWDCSATAVSSISIGQGDAGLVTLNTLELIQ